MAVEKWRQLEQCDRADDSRTGGTFRLCRVDRCLQGI